MGASGNSPASSDSVSSFLNAVRRPLAYVANGPPGTAERTQFPGRALAERGRELLASLSGEARELVASLCERLDEYDSATAQLKPEIARHALQLIEGFEPGAPAPVAKAAPTVAPPPHAPARPPEYRATTGDLGNALKELDRSIRYVRGIGPRRAELLGKFGIQTVEQLLYHLPFRYEDRRNVRRIADVAIGEEAILRGEIVQVEERIVGRARRRILEGVLRDPSGLLGLTWYHQVAYFRNRYRTGVKCLVFGKIERSPGGGKRITHPEVDFGDDDAGAGILPVYNKPTTITVGAMRKLVQEAAEQFAAAVPSALPAAVARRARVADLQIALAGVHLPAADADLEALSSFRSLHHRSLVFDELFFLQLGLALRRRSTLREAGIAMPGNGRLADRLDALLPFALTGAQRRVVADIRRDMAAPHPMHRLVQGDVGSGKTIVALCAALAAIEHEHQVAFMAPTELLAEQHFRTLAPFAEKLGLRSVLLTGELTRAEKSRIHAALAAHEIDLVVGTHAIIQEGVRLPAIGLGVIDEQHRFGVLQRAALRSLRSGEEGPAPHILLLTATPIPRTLAMTVYGDLDVSALDELPPGRQPVRTLVFREHERQRAYQLVLGEVERGHQAYVVYPLVESSEKEDLRDATTMARELADTVFRQHRERVGLLHGRMKGSEKDAMMRRFRDGELRILVSTTVIEVGVDVPNATVMVIEHAERFGLSQLHQLRGRVGRGSERAQCILIAPYRRDGDVERRMRAMCETTDGFRIAEVDLELRGPGEFLGTRQSGLPDFRVANLIRDSRILLEARQSAEAWLAEDPDLSKPESSALREVLKHRWAGRLGLATIG